MSRQLYATSQLEQIYKAALRLLKEMGMRVHNRQALEALEAFGAKLDYPSQCAFMSEELVNRMLDIVKADYADWSPERPFMPQKFGRGGGGACPFYFDDDSWSKKRAGGLNQSRR